ncbi:hypothetical protein TSACC_2788 [Terrimicrobium sacchariphilum]|uniref:Uncharacterized protein n=1 Tax=Terrimicrobium sacchariphilum TaxID=690879 RepID=A0A146G422_TERSA|nr:hypothetical protein [Terrimicrobium sacchariphilum]GAT32390.1 hypothetical protein TSACC_2788 [Terrimicrobium sacchariphilum]
MINHIPERSALVVLGEQEACDLRVDQGIPSDLEKRPEIKDYFASLDRDKGG